MTKQRRFTEEERDSFRQRYLAGEEVKALTKEFGCSRSQGWLLTHELCKTRKRQEVNRLKAKLLDNTQIDLGWIAGIIDGEGWIGIAKTGKNALCPRITVAATNPKMADTLAELCGGHTCWKVNKKATQQDTKSWDLYSIPTVLAFCMVMIPFLKLKDEQARVATTFCKLRIKRSSRLYTNEEWQLYNRMKQLNKRGR